MQAWWRDVRTWWIFHGLSAGLVICALVIVLIGAWGAFSRWPTAEAKPVTAVVTGFWTTSGKKFSSSGAVVRLPNGETRWVDLHPGHACAIGDTVLLWETPSRTGLRVSERSVGCEVQPPQ